MTYIAFDTETTRFPDRKVFAHKSHAIALSPFETPRLILGSWATVEDNGVLMRDAFLDKFTDALADPGMELVFQNAQFDLNVILLAKPELKTAIITALFAGRIHDTKMLDMLLRLRDGIFDYPVPPTFVPLEMRGRSLAVLAQEYCGMVLCKDDEVRLNFADYEDEPELPPKFREYALRDAIATLNVWLVQVARTTPDERLLSEPIQTRADWAVSQWERRGLRIDRLEALRLYHLFAKDLAPLQNALVKHGLGTWKTVPKTTESVMDPEVQAQLDALPLVDNQWVFLDQTELRGPAEYASRLVRRWRPKNRRVAARFQVADGAFALKSGLVRLRLEKLARERGLGPKRSPKNNWVVMDSEWWRSFVPVEDEALMAWLELDKLRKILQTYLTIYSNVDRIYPKWLTLGARSGRMACRLPNVQNIPKRRHGIRSLFLPDPNRVMVIADYSTQELLTLAQTMYDMEIAGPLIEGIQSGHDLHTRTAALLLDKPIAGVTKSERQTAKAVNFGVPGGLGAAKLAEYAAKEYNLRWSIPKAQDIRTRFLSVYPDIKRYLQQFNIDMRRRLVDLTGRSVGWWCKELGLGPNQQTMWWIKGALEKHKSAAYRELYNKLCRDVSVRLRTGRRRSRCIFTEAANTGFQGLASDVTKTAVFLAEASGLEVIMAVHDEIVVQCPEAEAESAQEMLEKCMKEAFKEICPLVGQYAKVDSRIDSKWGMSTGADGKEV